MWMILRIRFLSIGRMLLDLRPAEDPSSIECVRLACSTVRRGAAPRPVSTCNDANYTTT
jgi:hypothetical protein